MLVYNVPKIAVTLCAAALFLSACGSSSSTSQSGVLSASSINLRMAEADAAFLKVVGDGTDENPGFAGTKFDAIPTSGSAVYRGFSTVEINDGDDMVLDAVGIANVNVNFGATGTEDVVTGNLRNMRAVNANGDTGYVSGELLLSGGAIGKDFDDAPDDARQNSLFSDYAGTLTVLGETYGLAGELQGQLHGTRTNEGARSVVRGVSLSDEDSAVAASVSGLTANISVTADNELPEAVVAP
ncbi:hypothetical protein FHS72_001832 [Loktanella ponticola]|uniref:Transferrin-binding protein B C-lobe/N-lobe beta barrel domain-containing protein n=1 Tax=Yoonia ponticola TaxID=1524255 RepID=A0A7W9BKH4_9RHOB|nr:hypothetical protein [Yoonia ponticola]MBB5722208.1 hypothetical protein [Yoonia ponticola]